MNKKKILLVEDEPDIQKATKVRLEYEGFDVVTVCNGEEALQAIGQQGVDLILLDLKLPKMSGFQVVQQLKGAPSTQKIPVLLLTASAELERRMLDSCIELGVADWIRKPYLSRDLLTRIRKILDGEGGEQNAA